MLHIKFPKIKIGKIGLFLLVMSCHLCIPALSGVETNTKDKIKIKQQKLNELYFIGMLRSKAINNPEHVVKQWMSQDVYKRWQDTIKVVTPENSPSGLADFFAAAVAFCGKNKANTRCWGFYNVWQDVILLFELKKSPQDFSITDFIFLPGEIFRKNEKMEKNEKMPCFVYKYLHTEAAFNSFFGSTPFSLSKTSFYQASNKDLGNKIKSSITQRTINILTVVQPHTQMYKKFLDAVKAIRTLNVEKKTVFIGSTFDEFRKIPKKVRDSFMLRHWEFDKDSTCFVFSNSQYPALTIFVLAENKTNGMLKILPVDLRFVGSQYKQTSK